MKFKSKRGAAKGKPPKRNPADYHRCARPGCKNMVKKQWPFCFVDSQYLPAELRSKVNRAASAASFLPVNVASDPHHARDLQELADAVAEANEYFRIRHLEEIERRDLLR